MGHHHHHTGTGTILKWSAAATAAFVVFEAIAGWRAHSLSLLSDAGHNATDALALLLAWFSYYLQQKPADNVKTYGYHRAGVLAAFVNALTLVLLALYLFWESYQRILAPEPVQEGTMMVVALAGLIVNGSIMWGLHRDSQHDLNIRAAFVHMLGDALGSAAIIIGAVVIRYTGWMIVDPILSIIIAALVVWTAWDIIKDSLNILLEGSPRGLSTAEVVRELRALPGINDVHHVHIWSLGAENHAMSCHVTIDDMPLSDSSTIRDSINSLLCDRFHIHHTTLQVEHRTCEEVDLGCQFKVAHHQH